jgi:hypothetical protein
MYELVWFFRAAAGKLMLTALYMEMQIWYFFYFDYLLELKGAPTF